MSQFVTPFQVVKLIKVFDIVPLEIQDLKVLYETNIKQLIDLVVTYVELLKLLKGLNTLDFLQLAPAYMQNFHIFERGSNISKS